MSRLLALSLLLLIAANRPAAADSIALTFTGGSNTGSGFTRGWEFSTSAPLVVTSLGWWDAGNDGLSNSHQVDIWDTSGNVLLSATVAAGTTDPLLSGFRFDSTLTGTPTLAAGTYVIGGLSTTSDPISYIVPAGNLTLAPGITFVQNRTNSTDALGFPSTTLGGVDAGLFGPSFRFVSPSAVPEPASFVMAGTAALAGLGYAWRRRNRVAA